MADLFCARHVVRRETATTPGTSFAAAVSMESTLARGCALRTAEAISMPGR
jgi:hypothetical protein